MGCLAAALLALGASGCDGSGGAGVEGPVTVYVSLPLTGPRAAEGKDAADGARLALEQAGGKAGDLEVGAEFLDDARGKPWDPVAVAGNARTAARDSSTAGYIGELDSQPTRASVPITNQAGIAQISPGAGAVDLTRPAQGYPDSPDRYQPSGSPTFARVVPDDAALAAGAADLASGSGARSAATSSSRSPYERLSAVEFERAAGDVGLEIVEPGSAADVVFRPGQDGEVGLDQGGSAPGRRLLAPVLDPAGLPDSEFTGQFQRRFERSPGPYAAYGYEAMSLLLAAIDSAAEDDDFRPAVVSAVLEAERPESILGIYSITEQGDTTLCAVQPYSADGRPEEPICPGG